MHSAENRKKMFFFSLIRLFVVDSNLTVKESMSRLSEHEQSFSYICLCSQHLIISVVRNALRTSGKSFLLLLCAFVSSQSFRLFSGVFFQLLRRTENNGKFNESQIWIESVSLKMRFQLTIWSPTLPVDRWQFYCFFFVLKNVQNSEDFWVFFFFCGKNSRRKFNRRLIFRKTIWTIGTYAKRTLQHPGGEWIEWNKLVLSWLRLPLWFHVLNQKPYVTYTHTNARAAERRTNETATAPATR